MLAYLSVCGCFSVLPVEGAQHDWGCVYTALALAQTILPGGTIGLQSPSRPKTVSVVQRRPGVIALSPSRLHSTGAGVNLSRPASRLATLSSTVRSDGGGEDSEFVSAVAAVTRQSQRLWYMSCVAGNVLAAEAAMASEGDRQRHDSSSIDSNATPVSLFRQRHEFVFTGSGSDAVGSGEEDGGDGVSTPVMEPAKSVSVLPNTGSFLSLVQSARISQLSWPNEGVTPAVANAVRNKMASWLMVKVWPCLSRGWKSFTNGQCIRVMFLRGISFANRIRCWHVGHTPLIAGSGHRFMCFP